MSTVTATKKRTARNAAPPTPEEQAILDAEDYLRLKSQIAGLEEILKTTGERICAYYKETGRADIGGLLAIQERNNPVKITGANGKRLDMLLERLMKELPEGYVKEQKKLDLGRMFASLDSDPALRALLNEAGLKLEQETSLVLKAI